MPSEQTKIKNIPSDNPYNTIITHMYVAHLYDLHTHTNMKMLDNVTVRM